MLKFRRASLRNQHGQIAIMIALMTVTMMIVFALVINVGLTVHAKINLQNAADLAATSAAAQQARILTEIGRKNFELRQNYKEFLYLNWVLHNRDNFWEKRGNNVQHPPVFCLEGEINKKLDRPLNLCGQEFRPEDQAKIHHNPFYFLSPFGAIAYLVTKGILEPKFINAFKDIGGINKSHAEEDVRKYVGNSQVIWHSYLRNLESLLNSGGNVSATVIHEWKSRVGDRTQETGLDAASVPTPPKMHGYDAIAAATAKKNLSGLNTTGYRFFPLRPRTGNYIDLSKAERSFYVWYADFKQLSDGTITRENKPIPARNFILGAKKVPGSLTYYAVKLESRPDLPFLPGQFNSKLEAYAAAKPFGSRIGPPQDDPLFPRNGHYESTPNISFYERDSQGYQNPNIRRALASKILDDGQAPSREAIPVSRFPSLYETNRFIVGPEDLSWRQQWGGLNLIGALFSPRRKNQFLTSWGPDGNKRLGYSVKLIPIEEILRSGNPPAETEELRLIRH